MEDRGISRSNDLPAALVPADDGEVSLGRGVVAAEEAHFTHARTAVEDDQRRIADIFPADQHPLINPAEARIPGLRNTVVDEGALMARLYWKARK
jgi:hypothetical protein